MGDIPNLPLFAAQIWAKNDNMEELQSMIFWSLIEVISSLGGKEKGGRKPINAIAGSK